jgi:hypothetical protein
MARTALVALLLVAALAGPAPAHGTVPPKLPVEAVGRLPFLDQPVLSPDGNRIAAQINANGASLLGIIDLRTPKSPPALIPTGDNVILWTRWAGNDRLLIGFLREIDTVYAYGRISQLILYDVAKKDMRVLSLPGQAGRGDDVIHVADDGSFILLSVARNLASFPEVFRVELDNAKFTNVVPQKQFISEWIADADGIVKAGSGVEYRKIKYLYRASAAEEFSTVARVDIDVRDVEIPQVLFRRRGEGAWILTNGTTGRIAVYELDPRTFTPGKEVFAHPTADVTEARLNPEGTAIEAIYYADDRPRVVWLDERMKAVQSELDEALAGRPSFIVASSQDRSRFIV